MSLTTLVTCTHFQSKSNRMCKKCPIVYSPRVKLHEPAGQLVLAVTQSPHLHAPQSKGTCIGQSRTDHLGHCMSAKWSSVAARPSLGPESCPQCWAPGRGPVSKQINRSYRIRALPWRRAAHCNLGFVPFWIWKKMTASSLVLPSKLLLSHLLPSLLSSEFRFFTKVRKHSYLPEPVAFDPVKALEWETNQVAWWEKEENKYWANKYKNLSRPPCHLHNHFLMCVSWRGNKSWELGIQSQTVGKEYGMRPPRATESQVLP